MNININAIIPVQMELILIIAILVKIFPHLQQRLCLQQ